MRGRLFVLLSLCALLGGHCPDCPADQAGVDALVIRVPPAKSADQVQRAINACGAAGGGTVVLAAGVHRLDAPLRFHDAANITLVGQGQAILALAPQLVLTAAERAEAGQTFVVLAGSVPPGSVAGSLEVQAPGRIDGSPQTGRQRQIPYFSAAVKRVEAGRLILSKPLAYAVPAGTRIVSAYNAIEITGRSHDLAFRHLVLNGNRQRWPCRPRNHSRHCGIFIAGAYSYEKGPLAEPVKGIAVGDCTVRGFHHRGIALYSVVESSLSDCRIAETGGEGIDLDHFVFRCRVTACQVRRAAVGVELNDASHCTVNRSIIEDCPTGIKLWRWCTLDGLNTQNVFTGNQVRRASRCGIDLAGATSRSTVTGNTIEDCGTGIQLECTDSVVGGNQLRRCRQELVLAGAGNFLLALPGPRGPERTERTKRTKGTEGSEGTRDKRVEQDERGRRCAGCGVDGSLSLWSSYGISST